jgi:hypothetical protein
VALSRPLQEGTELVFYADEPLRIVSLVFLLDLDSVIRILTPHYYFICYFLINLRRRIRIIVFFVSCCWRTRSRGRLRVLDDYMDAVSCCYRPPVSCVRHGRLFCEYAEKNVLLFLAGVLVWHVRRRESWLETTLPADNARCKRRDKGPASTAKQRLLSGNPHELWNRKSRGASHLKPSCVRGGSVTRYQYLSLAYYLCVVIAGNNHIHRMTRSQFTFLSSPAPPNIKHYYIIIVT